MTTKSFLPGNLTDYIPVAVFIFTCGIVYNTIASLAIKNSELENRLEKKIIIINELTERVAELELYRAWEEGKRHGSNE